MVDQPRFLNMALEVETERSPHELLAMVKRIEREIGRAPTYRWGPRIVDIDILLYGDALLDDQDLTIPHREMARRAFVLVPLAEIAPEITHPASGHSMERMLEAVSGKETVLRFSPPRS